MKISAVEVSAAGAFVVIGGERVEFDWDDKSHRNDIVDAMCKRIVVGLVSSPT